MKSTTLLIACLLALNVALAAESKHGFLGHKEHERPEHKPIDLPRHHNHSNGSHEKGPEGHHRPSFHHLPEEREPFPFDGPFGENGEGELEDFGEGFFFENHEDFDLPAFGENDFDIEGNFELIEVVIIEEDHEVLAEPEVNFDRKH